MMSATGFLYRKLIALLVFLSALAFLITGCGEDDSRNVIRIMYWGVSGSKEIVQKAIEEFEKAHPEFKVRAETAPYRGSVQGYEEKLIVLIGAKDPPDVAMLTSSRVPEYAKMGGLSKLDSYVSEKPGWLADIEREKMAGLKVKGSLYAIPSGYEGIVWTIPSGCKHRRFAWEIIGGLVKNGYKPLSRLSKTS